MEIENYRTRCYKCYRPQSSCMCKYITPIDTDTQFIILMHPKEFQKTKNGTGYFTSLSLKNSKIYKGIDFTHHKDINKIIHNPKHNCYILYPDKNSINLNTRSINEKAKKNIIFIIDSTWACSKSILRNSKNLHNLQKISFTYNQPSNFKIKTQPNSYCLSTIESTLCVLKLLNHHNIENIKKCSLDTFLNPFNEMVKYQLNKAIETNGGSIRYKKPYKKI